MREKKAKTKVHSKSKIAVLLVILAAIVVALFVYIRHNQIITSKNVEELKAEEILENFTTSDEISENELSDELIDEIMNDENLIQEDIKNSNLENKKENLNTGTTTYKLEVNCTANVVNVYTKDEEGNYTKCVKAMVCSIGGHTPRSGTYKLKNYKGSAWRWRNLFEGVYGQYATWITGNILFHSVPYTERENPGSLEYWEFDKLGTVASLGCVRLKVSDVKWIWDNCATGTLVRFYEDSNPGPLGKPGAPKISSNEACRNWDPTDPDPNNPWKTYQAPVVTPDPPEVDNPPIEDEPENTIVNNTIENTTNEEPIENTITNTTPSTNTIQNTTTNTIVETNETNESN